MGELLHDPVNVWLLAGALIIVFEAFTAPGLGLFLAGLGAIFTSFLIKAGLVSEASTGAQFAWCFGLTMGWTVLLWKPLRKFRMQRKSKNEDIKSNNLIGEIATVSKTGLKRGEVGQVLWSGTLMNAELEHSSGADLPEGAKVKIHSVTGNTLKVSPR